VPYYESENVTLYNGDCLDVLETLPENSVDSVVTDPPYGLSFDWDHGVPGAEFWAAVKRVAKPGAYLLAFGGTRTYHRLACAIEDAKWEIRDCMMWLRGQGFPKGYNFKEGEFKGWGTALKPSWEPIVVAMKPLDGTYKQNASKWAVGGLNIGGSRIGDDVVLINRWTDGAKPFGGGAGHPYKGTTQKGRWPSNVILDEGSAQLVEEQAKGASRFFYCAKANKKDRGDRKAVKDALSGETTTPFENTHPTVKPMDLMRYLCTLTATPRGGVVLDPFSGSGTTLLAARECGRQSIGIEVNEDHCEIAATRLRHQQEALLQQKDK
jgi:site-specific DNA-methyltransferase (adenine-specific)